MLKTFFKKLVMQMPFNALGNVFPFKLSVSYYHMVSNDGVTHVKHLYPHKTIKQFSEDMDFIIKWFTPISMIELLAFVKRSKFLHHQVFHLTFDDGFREMYDIVAPILYAKGIPATFFVNSAFTDNKTMCYQHKASLIVDHLSGKDLPKSLLNQIHELLPDTGHPNASMSARILGIKYAGRDIADQIAAVLEIDTDAYLRNHQPYLTSEQISTLIKQGFTIGGHSIDHPLYSDLTLDEQVRQTTESMRFVRETFHLDYGAFAFPHTDHGVSKEYFRRIAQTGLVDISFGTAGMIEDCVPHHYQRFSLERPLIPVESIMKFQIAKYFWCRLRDKNKITRP